MYTQTLTLNKQSYTFWKDVADCVVFFWNSIYLLKGEGHHNRSYAKMHLAILEVHKERQGPHIAGACS